jgi:ribosomal-protein-alanine N-acetyltransferase
MDPMPELETERLRIRALRMADLDAVFRILDVELAEAAYGSEHAASREARAAWLRWTVAGYEQLARLNQPPYGERGVTLKAGGELAGLVGYVPSLGPFEGLPGLGGAGGRGRGPVRATPEVGLFWAIAPRHQRRGYATEAARAMIGYALRELGLKRIVATTDYDNVASIGVMKKLGMEIVTNPSPEPAWLQVVGVARHE